MSNLTKSIVRAGLIGGMYVILSLLTMPIASGAIQFRLSEALTLLPLFFPEAIMGLFVGCLLSNLITGCLIIDVILGSITTLVAGVLTYYIGRQINKMLYKIIIGGFFPIALNAFILPLIWLLAYNDLEYIYGIQVLLLLVSQAISIYACGTPLCMAIKKHMEKK